MVDDNELKWYLEKRRDFLKSKLQSKQDKFPTLCRDIILQIEAKLEEVEAMLERFS